VFLPVQSMATNFWKRPGVRRTRRVAIAAIVLGTGLYLVPVVALIYVVCGLIDVSRHQKITAELLENISWETASAPG
jgi:hypothetical protein